MVEELFRQDAYIKEADATVTALEERGVRLDRTIFYPTGGGQPGDTGVLRWDGGEAKIVDAVKADGGDVLHVLAPGAPRPAVGAKVQLVLDWDRRYRHMRMHTALHVMSAVIRGNVTGGQVGADKSRLDFNLEGEVPAKEWVTAGCLGQMTFDKKQAETIGKIFGLPLEAVKLLQVVPYKGSLPTAVPTDPLIYRWYEIVNVYGTTIKELIHEEFGDGIMSAIDFKMDIVREPDPKGDRVLVTMSGKFLPYKTY